MSAQNELYEVINEKMSDEEVREALLDITLLLSNTERSKEETYDMLVEIFQQRIENKYIY